ncbi:MAG: MATE family efflux transporter [Clostridia bacterium]|nr:MATE family efflux transporter [Clostridia bacterium]
MNAKISKKQHLRMTSEPIPKLIFSLSLPTAVGMAVIALYTLADAYFVSSLGTSAGAAVGVVFAIHVLIQAVGYTLGMGGGSLLSRCLGKKEEQGANDYATVALVFSILAGGLITALTLLFRHPLIHFLGATESIYPFALDYSIPLFWSAIPMCGTFVLSQLLRAEGKAVWSMTGLAVGSLANIGLDPLLIHNLGMGISGASTATLISQILSFSVLLSAYCFRRSQLRLFQEFHFSSLLKIGRIFIAGLPSLLRQGLSGIATVLLNHATAPHGDAAITAMSIVNRLFLLVFSLCLGFGQGLMPVVGYNYGANNEERAKKAYLFSLFASSGIMLLISIPLAIFAPAWIGFFREDPDVISIGAYALRLQCAVLFTHGAVTCTIMFLQALGRSIPATILASARQGLFFLPLIFLLPAKFGLHGLILTQPLADLLTGIFAIFFAVYGAKLLGKKQKTNNKKGTDSLRSE